MGHTPEPWIAIYSPLGPYGQLVGHPTSPTSRPSIGKLLNVSDAERAENCVNACGGYSKVNGEWVKTHARMDDPVVEIARLRAERDKYEKAYTELKNAANRNGFLDSQGRMRKLLPASSGPTLYVTTDGCIVGNTTAIIYAFEMHPGCRFSGKIITMKYETWFATKWDDDLPSHWADKSPDRVWGCYSTREAAELAALSAKEADTPASKNKQSAYELKASTSLRSVMDKVKESE